MTEGGKLEVRDLVVRYSQVTAVRGVNLTVPSGSAVLLVGANGAGKSSLLKAIAGLVPFRGSVEFDGLELGASLRNSGARHGVALVPEGRGTLSTLTVAENLRIGAYVRRDREIVSDVDKWLDFFPPLRSRVKQRAGSLSGGEQQMLAIARAMMGRPRLLLLDEPSMGLAPAVAETMFGVIGQLLTQGVSALIVEQNLARAIDIVSKVHVLSLGEMMLHTTPSELAESRATRDRMLNFL